MKHRLAFHDRNRKCYLGDKLIMRSADNDHNYTGSSLGFAHLQRREILWYRKLIYISSAVYVFHLPDTFDR